MSENLTIMEDIVNKPINIIWIATFCTSIFFISIFFLRKRNSNKLEELNKVEIILEKFGGNYDVYRNLIIPVQGGMSCIDFVIVSPYGIFVIDIRMERGTIIGKMNAREWAVGKQDRIFNPLWKNRTSMNGLEKELGGLYMKSIIIFPFAKLPEDLDAGILKPNQIEDFIKTHNKIKISSKQLKFIKETLGSL